MATTRRLTYFRRNPVTCPVCGTSFRVEEMFTGRGRISAGELTGDLRRLYEDSKEFGKVRPVIYSVWVCPKCLYATTGRDFEALEKPAAKVQERLTNDRVNVRNELFPEIDFTEERGLKHGVASYMLAMTTASGLDHKMAPMIRKAMYAMRAAWLSSDLHGETQEQTWDLLSFVMFQKAKQYYQKAIDFEEKGVEMMNSAGFIGPDVDQNFGYDGARYLLARLSFKFAPFIENVEARVEAYNTTKKVLSRVFGFGQSSKEKPGPLLEIARKLYEAANGRLAELEAA